jgi:glycosyltransferase involved in cell wall biosynthesis
MRILVIMYNHESTLAATLDRIPVDFRPRIDEILVFDDASADKTVDVALRWGAANGETPTTVVRHLKNLGYCGTRRPATGSRSSAAWTSSQRHSAWSVGVPRTG